MNANDTNISESNPIIYVKSGNSYNGVVTSTGTSVNVTIDMICTPIEKGTTTITVAYAGAVIKKFTINVTDPIGLE